MSGRTPAEIRSAARAFSAASHPGQIRSHFPYWDTRVRPFLLLAVEALPQAQFGFKPQPGMLTAQQVIVHIAEAEYGWLGTTVAGEPDEEWVRPAAGGRPGWQLAIEAPDHAALFALLERSHLYAQRWFDQPVADLERIYTVQAPDGTPRNLTLHWILDRMQEHEIHHRAQLNLYLRMLGIDPPSI